MLPNRTTHHNYIYFETDSSDAYFKQFGIVQTSEGFSIRYILYWKTHCVFPNVEFFWFFGGVLDWKRPVLKILKMLYLFPNHFSGRLLDYSVLVKNDH